MTTSSTAAIADDDANANALPASQPSSDEPQGGTYGTAAGDAMAAALGLGMTAPAQAETKAEKVRAIVQEHQSYPPMVSKLLARLHRSDVTCTCL